MSNPVVYFSVAKIDVKGKTKHYLCPLRSNAVLTKRFSETDVIIENIAFYNRYTTKFIAAHVGSNDYFYSDDYEYNPDLCTFNFNVLNICTDADWEKMQYDTGFDASKKYEFAKGE